VGATATRLRDLGIEAEARVALRLDRSPEAVILLWALWRVGAVAVPLSTRLPPDTVKTQIHQVRAPFFVVEEGDDNSPLADGTVYSSKEVVVTRAEEGIGGSSSLNDLARDRSATIVFTSGSTGTPKAALHTWGNHLYSAKGSNANIPLRPGDRWLLSLPLYHVGGLAVLVRCAMAGAAVAVPDGDRSIAEAVGTTKATHISLVATQFRRLLRDTDGTPPPSLRAVLLGGGPVPDALLRQGHAHGWPLHTTYGCTEMASQVTTTPPGASLDTLRTAGRRLPHRRVCIEDGEILVAGRTLFRGYVTEDGIDDPRTDDGWYRTGDRGRLDASGRLHVRGRMDRMFVSGGENVQPEEIEEALERLDGVARAVVVPVPDAEYGHRPVAFLRGPAPIQPQALRDALADLLPRFKIPDAFHSLPEDAIQNGLKIDHERLRRQARMLRRKSTPERGPS
jgi:O-succinylbenzoic acid--CoA ligase